MVLFQKTPEELREAFVRSRFAETSMFGQHDIVEWIERERQAKRPHIPEEPTVPLVSQWQRLTGSDLLHVTDPQAAVVLLSHGATPVGNFGIEQTAPRIGNWGPFSQMLGTHVDGARVYVGYHAFVILELGTLLYIQRIMRGIERGVEEEGLISRPFELNMEYTSRAVADVLLGEWARGRPRMQQAREALCDSIEHRVRKERVKAEHDFDTAVAVSADGTKIVNADLVVVVPVPKDDRGWFIDAMCARSLPMWPASAFTDKKILRSNHMLRSEFPKPGEMWGFNFPGEVPTHESAVKAGYHVARRETHEFNHCRQIYCEMRLPSGMQRLFFTAPNFCPSPLPEGGVEVAV